jgi:EmrB/QacA subfamily drug resistance transporter
MTDQVRPTVPSRATGVVTPQRAALMVASLALFMALMDGQIVNVALAAITRGFGSATASSQWLITAYVLSLAAAMPASGWLGDRFGTRRVILCAIVVFTAASALCAIAPSLGLLIVVRVLQGVGGGMFIPVSLAAMYRAYSPAGLAGATRTTTMISMIAPATAPLIGGLIVTEASWRWIFLINVPFGFIAFLLTVRYLDDYRREGDLKFDLAGLVLGGAAVALILYAISDGPLAGWGSPRVIVTAAVGLALLVWFVRSELASVAPMLDLRLLSRQRLFRSCCGLQVLQPMIFIGCLVFTALYVQQSRGFSPLTSGTATVPEALGVWCASGFVTRLYRRLGPRRLVATGFALMAVGAVLLAQMGGESSLWLVRGCTFLLGVGTAFAALPIRTAAFAQIDPQSTGHASALFNTGQRIGLALGVAGLSSVLTVVAGTTLHPPASAFSSVFLVAAGVGLLGFLLSWRIVDRDAAATMDEGVAGSPRRPRRVRFGGLEAGRQR